MLSISLLFWALLFSFSSGQTSVVHFELHQNLHRYTVNRTNSILQHNELALEFHNVYATQISIGQQSFFVSIDTVSPYLFLTGTYCSSDELEPTPCGSPSTLYNMSISKTAEYVPCSSSCVCDSIPNLPPTEKHCYLKSSFGFNEYLQGSLNMDQMVLEQVPKMNYHQAKNSTLKVGFAQVFVASPRFIDLATQNEIVGILGLGRRVDSPVEPILDTLVNSNIADDVFSMCFGPKTGHLILGGNDPDKIADKPSVEIPLTNVSELQQFYTVKLSTVVVNNNRLANKSYNAIIYVGSPTVSFPAELFDAVKKELSRDCSKAYFLCEEHANSSIWDPSQCFTLSHAEVLNLPSIFLNFDVNGTETSVEFLPNYFMRMKPQNNVECVTIGILRSSYPHVILGDVFLRQFYSTIDRSNGTLKLSTPKNCGEWKTGIDYSGNIDVWMSLLVLTIIAVGCVLLVSVLYFGCDRLSRLQETPGIFQNVDAVIFNTILPLEKVLSGSSNEDEVGENDNTRKRKSGQWNDKQQKNNFLEEDIQDDKDINIEDSLLDANSAPDTPDLTSHLSSLVSPTPSNISGSLYNVFTLPSYGSTGDTPQNNNLSTSVV